MSEGNETAPAATASIVAEASAASLSTLSLSGAMPELFLELAGAHIEQYAAAKGAKFGITREQLGDWYARKAPATPDELEGVTEDLATEILFNRVWKPLRLDRLPEPVARAIFDVAVRRGVGEAVKLLQTALPRTKKMALLVDGRLGRETLTAIDALVKEGKEVALAKAILAERTTLKFRLGDGKLFGRDFDLAGAGFTILRMGVKAHFGV